MELGRHLSTYQVLQTLNKLCCSGVEPLSLSELHIYSTSVSEVMDASDVVLFDEENHRFAFASYLENHLKSVETKLT